MVQINDLYEDLTVENFERLDDLPPAGPRRRLADRPALSEPHEAVNTLTDPALYDGSVVGAWRKRFEEEAVKTPDTGEAAAQTASGRRQAQEARGRPGDRERRRRHPGEAGQGGRGAGQGRGPQGRREPQEGDGRRAAHRDAAPTPPPQSSKSYVATPSNPDEGKAAFVLAEPTTPVSGTRPADATTCRDGSESKPDVVVTEDNKSSLTRNR